MEGMKSGRAVVLSVAPVGQSPESFAPSPKSSAEVAADIVACARAGASATHLHVRDEKGQPTGDLAAFSRTLDLIRAESDILIQGSTGGLGTLTLEERCVAVNEPRVEMASLNIGSVNFGDEVYVNTLPDARFWAGKMKALSVKPELEIFELGMLGAAGNLIQDGYLPGVTLYAFVLGVKWGLPADARVLELAPKLIPSGSRWGLLHHDMADFELMTQAVRMGASFVRVGFEDSLRGPPGGKIAKSNRELVAAAAEAIVKAGGKVATPAEAKAILDIPGRKK